LEGALTSTTQAWAWHHTGISVLDLNQSLAFYSKTFGFEPVFEAMDMSDLIQQLTGVPGLRADLVQCKSKLSDQVLELIKFRNIPSTVSELLPINPGRTHNCFLVENLDAAIEEVELAGGQLMGSVTEFSEGKAAYLSDGAGNAFELEQVQQGLVH
jgi:predicted enzyme related to lactoylglutathione lyase